jgi:hypothetical protein
MLLLLLLLLRLLLVFSCSVRTASLLVAGGCCQAQS